MAGKRTAEVQLRKEDDDDEDEDEENVAGTWSRASTEVLAARRIVKVGEKSSSSEEASLTVASTEKPKLHIDTTSNPFAAVSFTGLPKSDTSGDCQGFLAYANVNPFKAALASPLNNPISSKSPRMNPFSSTSPVVNPFMSFVEKKEDLWMSMSKETTKPETNKESSAKADEEDDEVDEEGDDNATDVVLKPHPTYSIATTEPIVTGEEGEECVTEMRVKLFRLEDKERKGWVDIGTGPVRVLRPKEVVEGASCGRVVMRRESQPGGHGTKLLVNVALKKHVDVEKHGDRAVRLTYISTSVEEEGGPKGVVVLTYLFKTKNVQDADSLFDAMHNLLKLTK